ncbi:MAG: hypothetical protein JEZ06_01630 [Anaerolineaceae bacterium]|nr:hypothetical protein [Anaerolineaceae bacterium]
MSEKRFCDSCGSVLTPGLSNCDACGQSINNSNVETPEVSAESWSQPEPSGNKPANINAADRWGSPVASPEHDTPSRWGSPQSLQDLPAKKSKAFNQPEKPGTPKEEKKGKKWGLIIVSIVLFLCLCIIASGFAAYTWFTQ